MYIAHMSNHTLLQYVYLPLAGFDTEGGEPWDFPPPPLSWVSPPPSKSPHTLKNMHNINVYDKLANKQNENI